MNGITRWLRVGMYVKRWLLLMMIGVFIISMAIAQGLLLILYSGNTRLEWLSFVLLDFLPSWLRGLLALMLGVGLFVLGYYRLYKSFLAPLLFPYSLSELADRLQTRRQLEQGLKVVAIGGGTGMPTVLRALKTETSNITAVVTVADDGGSSGRLRRELGVLPPGDLRNNLVALADDEDLMAQLLNYRFSSNGELDGHSFGNLFITALTGLMGNNLEHAAEVAGRVLAIRGRVLPATLTDVTLAAHVREKTSGKLHHIHGESKIPNTDYQIEYVYLEPMPQALPEVIQALLAADLIVSGPGSLYTSILSTLLVNGVSDAMRNSRALRVYVCNIATQPGETEGFNLADHIAVLENHLGEGLFDVVIANNHYPTENAGKNTIYVQPIPINHPIQQRYRIIYADLTQANYPWRHDSAKLRQVLLSLESVKRKVTKPIPVLLNAS